MEDLKKWVEREKKKLEEMEKRQEECTHPFSAIKWDRTGRCGTCLLCGAVVRLVFDWREY